MLAAPQLRNVDGARLVQFDEFLEQNELELAMSQIAELGLGYPCCGVFLGILENVAMVMELPERTAQFHEQFRLTLRRS